MRLATEVDIEALVTCVVMLTRFVKANGSDQYSDGLSSTPDHALQEYASQFVESESAFAFLEELNGQVIGCLAARIEETAFPPSGIGLVGKIEVCWVDPDHRGMGIATSLVEAAEQHFSNWETSTMEVSYLASNELAGDVWSKLGFQPFRVFSYKQLGGK